MIDSHCHLTDKQFRADMPDLLLRAKEASVHTMVSISDNLFEAKACREFAEKNDQIFYTAGVHPHAAKLWNLARDADELRSHASSKKLVAIGEIGLDYHYMNSPREDQIAAFREQITIAQELQLPIVVHNRESFEDLLPIIDDLKPQSMVLHCCTEHWANAKELVTRGYLLGFTGMATWPKMSFIRETIEQCPLTQMMIETDAPYLAPQSHRGQRCEPAFVAEVAQLVAEIKGVSLEEVDAITTKNTVDFYSLPSDILSL